MLIDEFNELPDAEAAALLRTCVAIDSWVSTLAAGRPYVTAEDLLDVGRAHRLVTPAIWSALVLRDRHCAFPGCTRMPLACDAHHIVHWADGGATSLDNLILLCRHHHTLTHHSPWRVHIDPGTRQPVWTGPPRLTLAALEGRMTYRDARPRGTPLVA